jgi:hypothetical protein
MKPYIRSRFTLCSFLTLAASSFAMSGCEDDGIDADMLTSSTTTSGTGTATESSSSTETTTATGSTSDANSSSETSTATSPYIVAKPVVGACAFAPRNPSRLVVTSSDHSTGAVGLVDVNTLTVAADLAGAHTDTALASENGLVYVINRFGGDSIKILDPGQNLALIAEFSLLAADDTGDSVNPYGLIRGDDGRLFISQFGRSEVAIWSDGPNPVRLGGIDLSPLADADGLAETTQLIRCGDTAFLASTPLDRTTWEVAGPTRLIPFDLVSARFFDEQNDGIIDSITLPGNDFNRFIADPRDTTGKTILVAQNPGLARVNLETGVADWAVAQETFEGKNIGKYGMMSFDLADDNDTLWISVASPDFSEFSLWTASLQSQGTNLQEQVRSLDLLNGAIEVIGSRIWVADTNTENPGLRVFDASASPIVEIAGSPLSVGLAPYSFLGLP